MPPPHPPQTPLDTPPALPKPLTFRVTPGSRKLRNFWM